MLFCGVYDMKNRALYLTKDSLRILTEGKFPMVPEAGPSMAGEISGKINQRVESIIANDRDNLPGIIFQELQQKFFRVGLDILLRLGLDEALRVLDIGQKSGLRQPVQFIVRMSGTPFTG